MRISTWKPRPPVGLELAPPAGPVYPQWAYENIHLKPMSTSLIRPNPTCKSSLPTQRIRKHPTEYHVHLWKRCWHTCVCFLTSVECVKCTAYLPLWLFFTHAPQPIYMSDDICIICWRFSFVHLKKRMEKVGFEWRRYHVTLRCHRSEKQALRDITGIDNLLKREELLYWWLGMGGGGRELQLEFRNKIYLKCRQTLSG